MSFTVLGALRDLDECRHRAELYRAWSTGLAAGLSSQVVLDQMGTISFPSVEEVRRYLVVGSGQGKSVTALVKARPNLFEPFEGAVLIAGDEAGTTGASLRLLTDYFARENRLRLRVRNTLGYPVFLGLLTAFGLPFLMLPMSPNKTYVKAIVGLLAAFLLLGGLFIGMLGSMLLGTPSVTRARFLQVLALTIEAGVPVGRAVRLAVDASGNPRLREHIKKRSERDLSTTPLATLFEGCAEVSQGLIGQMMVADATGEYRGTLARYSVEVERQK
jgi:type II secretory pathway component PulF